MKYRVVEHLAMAKVLKSNGWPPYKPLRWCLEFFKPRWSQILAIHKPHNSAIVLMRVINLDAANDMLSVTAPKCKLKFKILEDVEAESVAHLLDSPFRPDDLEESAERPVKRAKLDQPASSSSATLSAIDAVAPMAVHSYGSQIARKYTKVVQTFKKATDALMKSWKRIDSKFEFPFRDRALMTTICRIPVAPTIYGYRNKFELRLGHNAQGSVCLYVFEWLDTHEYTLSHSVCTITVNCNVGSLLEI